MASDSSLSTFPLLSLPGNVIRQTIRKMDIDGIIRFSLVSKRCKQHVISLNMKATSFKVSILRDVNFDIETSTSDFYLEFPSDETVMAAQTRKLKKPHCFTVYLDERGDITDLGQWKWTHFEYQDWLEHLWAVFHHQGINKLHFADDAFLYDLDDIKKVFGKADELYVEHTGCYDYNQWIFKKFAHIERIQFDVGIFQDSKFSSDILIQNINQLGIMGHDEPSQTMQLNDFLMINSKSIEIDQLEVSPKVMNKFIKLWMKGSNPRLEYLEITYFSQEIPLANDILKRIKYTKVPKNQRRQFKCCGREYTVQGGIDVQRKDGTRATIRINQSGNWHFFEMFIWHDHCFVMDRKQEKFIPTAHEINEYFARMGELVHEFHYFDLLL